MSKNSFDSLSTEQRTAAQEQIKQLRVKARTYRDAHNDLVSTLWDIDQKLIRNGISKQEQIDLKRKKEDTNLNITNKGYINKYHELINEIEQKEIELYGHSDIKSDSRHSL